MEARKMSTIKNKLIIGIDLSLNSTGITFRYNGVSSYLNILNKHVLTTSQKDIPHHELLANNKIANLISQTVDVQLLDNVPLQNPESIGLQDWERLHMKRCLQISHIMFTCILNTVARSYMQVPAEDTYVAIENYSYGSDTDNLIQVVELTMALKLKLFSTIPIKNFFIVPGPTLKMFAGKGDFDKYAMLYAYLLNTKGDNFLEHDRLNKLLNENRSLLYTERIKKLKTPKKIGNKKTGYTMISEIKKNEVKAPISDIIDSYFVALWLEDQLLQIKLPQ